MKLCFERNLVFACGEDKLTAIPVTVDTAAMAAQTDGADEPGTTKAADVSTEAGDTTAEGATTEAGGDGTADAPQTDEAATEKEDETGESIPSREESKSGGTFRTVLLILLAVAVAAGVVWVMLRRAKVNRIRAQKRKEIVDRFRNNKSR